MKLDNLNDWADLIERFLSNKDIGVYEWDDYIQTTTEHSTIEAVRKICGEVYFLYPANNGGYCSDEGKELLRDLARNLRMGSEATLQWVNDFAQKHRKTL